jgi:hypothetical protein
MFLSLKTEKCEKEEFMMCAGLSCIQAAPRLYIRLVWFKKYVKYANKCVTFQLRGYSFHFPGVFFGDYYWAHHVHKFSIASVFCLEGVCVLFWCGAIQQFRSAVGALLFFFISNYTHFHFLLSKCITVALLLAFNSLGTCVNVMDAVTRRKKRQFKRTECKIAASFD